MFKNYGNDKIRKRVEKENANKNKKKQIKRNTKKTNRDAISNQ